MGPTGIGIRGIDQIAVVVRDMEGALARYAAEGIGPWDLYTYGPHMMRRMTFRGEERPYVMKLALCDFGGTQYELIESVSGPSIYEEFLATKGEGLHHFGYYVEKMEAEIARMAASGYALLQSGHGFGLDGDGAYAYFDTGAALGCIVEAIARPKRMPVAEGRYPSAVEESV